MSKMLADVNVLGTLPSTKDMILPLDALSVVLEHLSIVSLIVLHAARSFRGR